MAADRELIGAVRAARCGAALRGAAQREPAGPMQAPCPGAMHSST